MDSTEKITEMSEIKLLCCGSCSNAYVNLTGRSFKTHQAAYKRAFVEEKMDSSQNILYKRKTNSKFYKLRRKVKK